VDRLERQLRRGEPRAWEELYDLHAAALLRLAYRLLFHVAEAEDIVQECLLSCAQALRNGSYRSDKGTLAAYLHRSVRNRCIDRLRQRGELLFSLDELESPPAGFVTESAELPWQMLEDEQALNEIQSAIRQLPPLQRTVLVLRVTEEHSYQEIADELGISLNYVKNLMGRARQRLRRILQPLISEREES
jgi:RNA polymerase sigma-70 factor (ECF subfamily)